MKDLIEETIEYVKDFFKNDCTGHDFYHTLRVYNLSKEISKEEKCDKEILYLTALLHDVDDYKLVGRKDMPFENLTKFLNSKNYPEEKIRIICNNISQISFKGNDTTIPTTIEGKIVQDADRLDAIGAIGIARTFAYGGSKSRPIYIPNERYKENMNEEEYYNNKGSSINHFYEKLLKLKNLMNTKKAKEIASKRHCYIENFLQEFFDELEGKI